jgi:hypothetical protein
MTPYRRRVVRLPLQRSLFGRLGEAAALVRVADAFPDGRFAAWLDAAGDLFIDPAAVRRLVDALPASLTAEHVEAVEWRLRACCEALTAATEYAASRAPDADEAELRRLACELGERVAALLPYGILSKFVPDALLAVLAAQGDRGVPPFPRPSPGAELAAGTTRLWSDCLALGWPPQRLEAEWPVVESRVRARVVAFCRENVGFGPLQWEAPGYERPRYVFAVMRATFAEPWPVAGAAAVPAPAAAPSAAGTESPSLTRRHLAVWLHFLERETWYVRRAFYRGMVPLLRRLAGYGGRDEVLAPEDLLFLEIDEIRLGAPAAERPARRREYEADSRYLARHGIHPGRLADAFEELT